MMTFTHYGSVLAAVCLSLSVSALMAEERQNPGFGGPDAVENLIEDDAGKKAAFVEERASESWFDWKKSLQEEYGLSFGIDYSTVFLNSRETGVSGDDNAASGMVRFFGAWDLVGLGTKNTGAFIWKVEHRHRYTDVAPKGFGFDQGAIALISPPFNDDKGRLTNLYWRQRMNDGKTTVVAGMLDSTDYVDVFVLGSPWTGFLNLAFSIGTNTMYIPNDAALGVAVGSMLTDKMYIIGGIIDAYADPTDPFSRVDNFIDDKEYFTSVELGLTKAHDRIYFDNTHLTLWHVDESPAINAPSGWGASFQYVTFVNDKLMPFIRAGYADDGGTLMQRALAVGIGYQNIAGRDLLGVGYDWGEPNEKTFSPGLKSQQTIEVFYRFQLTQQIAITPDIQYIKDPALDPGKDSLWVLGLRARAAF